MLDCIRAGLLTLVNALLILPVLATAAATAEDQRCIRHNDAVRDALVRTLNARRAPSLCVGLIDGPWPDHSRDGGMGAPVSSPSAELMARIRRHSAGAITIDEPACREPVLWIGRISWEDGSCTTAVIENGEPTPPTLGPRRFRVRRRLFGGLRTQEICCQE